MIEVQLGKVSSEIKEATVQAWFLEEGDSVNAGDDVAELMVESGTVVVKAPAAGVLLEIYYDEGEIVKREDVLCQIDDEARVEEEPPIE